MSSIVYIALYYNLLVFFVVRFVITSKDFRVKKSLVNNQFNSFLLITVVLLHITFRPIDSKYFGDTETYKRIFDSLSLGWNAMYYNKDIGFYYLTYLLTKFCNITSYFCVMAILYVLPIVYSFKKEFRHNFYVPIILYITSFSFWGYGVNGVRNGVATSLVLFAFFYRKNNLLFLLSSLAAIFFFHKSVLLPILFFLLTRYVNNPKIYLCFWILSIPLYFILGNNIISILSIWDMFGSDDRLNSYFSPGDEYDVRKFSNIGFRWDFVLYSAVPVLLGCFYILKKKFFDAFYLRLFNTYLACNACWILVISVAYSNRFAYLSWFLIPVIMIYPLLKTVIVKNQKKMILLIVVCNLIFTYVYWLIK